MSTEKQQKLSYKQLFTSCFYLSAFTFGGGYVIVPLMKKKFVEELAWLSEDEMLGLVAIAQTAPGPVAVNTALMLGYQVFGPLGALVAIGGTIIPPLTLLMLISYFYHFVIASPFVAAVLTGMQAGVAAVIADVIFTMAYSFYSQRKFDSLLLVVAAFSAVFFFKLPIPLLIPICALIGLLAGYISDHRGRQGNED
ncbi:MAG: chromate transporter [Eubacteriales bacterium]|nr:chromate transporter [Eubacteriales bacterium]